MSSCVYLCTTGATERTLAAIGLAVSAPVRRGLLRHVDNRQAAHAVLPQVGEEAGRTQLDQLAKPAAQVHLRSPSVLAAVTHAARMLVMLL